MLRDMRWAIRWHIYRCHGLALMSFNNRIDEHARGWVDSWEQSLTYLAKVLKQLRECTEAMSSEMSNSVCDNSWQCLIFYLFNWDCQWHSLVNNTLRTRYTYTAREFHRYSYRKYISTVVCIEWQTTIWLWLTDIVVDIEWHNKIRRGLTGWHVC